MISIITVGWEGKKNISVTWQNILITSDSLITVQLHNQNILDQIHDRKDTNLLMACIWEELVALGKMFDLN